MDYLVSDIVRDAKVAFDENKVSDALEGLGDVDTLTLNEIIRSKVEDAARLVEAGAAHWLLGSGKTLSGTITWESQPGYGGGKIPLPTDFLRLLTFQMSDWSRPATDVITEDNPEYVMQSSRYPGVRGNPQRPVVAVTHGSTGMWLEFYSCYTGADAHIKQGRYVPVPKIDGDGYIALPDMLYSAVVYRVAAMTAESIGDANAAALLLAKSNELSGG